MKIIVSMKKGKDGEIIGMLDIGGQKIKFLDNSVKSAYMQIPNYLITHREKLANELLVAPKPKKKGKVTT